QEGFLCLGLDPPGQGTGPGGEDLPGRTHADRGRQRRNRRLDGEKEAGLAREMKAFSSRRGSVSSGKAQWSEGGFAASAERKAGSPTLQGRLKRPRRSRRP